MRIAFDGTALRPGRTGVGYYTEHLLHHLARVASNDELIVVSNRAIDTTAPLPPRVRIATPARRVPRMVWMQTLAVTALRDVEADVVHFTNGMVPLLSLLPTVVTIHDMSLRLYPRYHPPRRVLLNRPLVDLAARRADAIITVSESAKRDIVGLYNVNPRRVHVVHEAAAPSFKRVHDPAELERVRRRYRLEERIILYVGTIEPRKNLPTLIDAFAARRRTGELTHQLVCVGPYGWLSRGLEDRIARSNAAHAINFTGYVPFEVSPQDWGMSLALPVITLAVGGAAFIARQTRASMLEALQQEHIRTLRATATSTWKILYIHALRYASLPIVAGIALQFIGLFGGSVIAEQLFAMPGLGQAVQTSVSTHDAPAVQGVVVIATVVVVAVNLVLELATKFLDPKLRAS